MNLGWLKAAQTSIENSLHAKPRNVNNSQLVERVKERSSCCECFPGQMDDVLDRVCAFHVRRNYHRCFPKLVSNCRRRTLFTCTFSGIKWSYIYLQQEIRLESSITRVVFVFNFRFPFYYEIKIILVIWLLSPATKGSSFLYRKFVHPMLSSREQVSFF